MSKLRIFIFLTIVLAVLFVSNLVIYEALGDIFHISSSSGLVWLASVLGLLSLGFILSTIIGMRFYNIFTRISYTKLAVWMGLFVYLFLFSCVYGISLLIFGTLPPFFGQTFLVLTVLISIYGIFHARNVKVKEVKVSLPGLSAPWQGRRAIWISDLHLGQLHGASFARKIVRRINSLPHDIVFIGGDLFDGTEAPDLGELIASFKDVRAQFGTYFVSGNHEEFGHVNAFMTAIKGAGIRILADEKIEIEGLQIVGVDYHNASDPKRFEEILSSMSLDQDKPSILLKHEPDHLEIAQKAGISLQISGHTHRAQLWPLGYIAQAVYKGFAYGLKKLGDMHVYTSSGTGTWGPPMRVGTDSEIVVFIFE